MPTTLCLISIKKISGTPKYSGMLKKYWVMALMLPVEHMVQFYSSLQFKRLEILKRFGPVGDTSGVWECPDLTPVPVEGMPGKKKWLLQTSQNASMQYFVGEFDGVSFK